MFECFPNVWNSMKDIIVKLVNSKGGRKEYNVSTEVHSSDDLLLLRG